MHEILKDNIFLNKVHKLFPSNKQLWGRFEGFILPYTSWWTPCTLSGVYKESTGTAVGLHKESMNTVHREDSDGYSL
jgi:hypothetical protein